MKITRKQLMTINNLKLSGEIEKMEDSQFNEYCKELDKFVDLLPPIQEVLKKSFEERDSEVFSKNLLTILDMLTKIRANDLAQNSFKILSGVREKKYETVEVSLNDFLSAVSALSIDIQMVQYKIMDETDTDSGSAKAGGDDTEGRQKSILAVDDVSFLLTTLKFSLQNAPYKFTGVTSGSAALKFLEKHRPDLFILDIEMPEMNGYELANKIRALGQTAPIIFLTGNATSEYVLKALKAGAADFIVKPVDKELVQEKIRKYINQ